MTASWYSPRVSIKAACTGASRRARCKQKTTKHTSITSYTHQHVVRGNAEKGHQRSSTYTYTYPSLATYVYIAIYLHLYLHRYIDVSRCIYVDAHTLLHAEGEERSRLPVPLS